MDRLNVVVICLDTFRADIVGPGKKLSSTATPALDALAADSVRFNRCFTEPGQTIQVRNGCFTGRRGFPYAHGYYGWHEIPDEYPTIAEILLEHGYATGLIADTPHLFKPNMNQHRGFMTWEHIRGAGGDGWKTGSWDLIRELFKDYFGAYEPAVPEASATSLEGESAFLQHLHNVRDHREEADWPGARVFASARRWLRDNAGNAPFFLWIDCFEPHEVFDPPLAYVRRYNSTWDGPIYQQPRHILHPSFSSDMQGADLEVTSSDFIDYYTSCYKGEVTFTDAQIGALLDEIEQLKLLDDTAVVFFTDHGTELADHSGWGKRNTELHPFNTQQNLTIRHPDERYRDVDVDAWVQNYDLGPTILDLAGISEAPATMNGHSVWALATGELESLRAYATTAWAGRVSVRDERWVYATGWDFEDPNPELYDLLSDPHERHNVHDAHPEIVGDRRSRIEELLGTPVPQPYSQDRFGPTVGGLRKPLYATSYAPVFYGARQAWDSPRALPSQGSTSAR